MKSEEVMPHDAVAMTLLSTSRGATMRTEISALPLSDGDEAYLVEMLKSIEQKASRIYELCTVRSP